MSTKKGISLIVLVITIIVMIILAATIIINLTNNNVIDNANKAVEDTELANAKTLASMAWSDAYIKGKTTPAELQSAVEDALGANDFDLDKYTVTVTDKGVEVRYAELYDNWEIGHELTAEEQEKYYKLTGVRTSITSGYENNGTAQTFTTAAGELEGLTWIYIGKDNEGNHLITTSEPQKPGTNGFKLYGANAWLDIKNGTNANPSQLDKVCKELYGKGGSQKVARSMKIEDIERILGYTGEKAAYYKTSVDYIPITDGKNKISELEIKEGTAFAGGSRKTPSNPSITDANFGDIRSDCYMINKTSDAGEMTNSANVGLVYKSTDYCLASVGVLANFSYNASANFQVRCVNSDFVRGFSLFSSTATSYMQPIIDNFAVRPVVSI